MTSRRNKIVGAGLFVLALLLGLLIFRPDDGPRGAGSATAGLSGATDAVGLGDADPSDEDLEQPEGTKPDDERFLRHVRERFGPTIDNKHTQIKTVEQIIAYLMKAYPDDWQKRVHDFLQALFPDRAEELYAKYEKLLRLNDWLAANRSDLGKMSRQDRQQALWDKRYELFGADADEIWEVTRKNEQIGAALDAIAAAPDAPIDQKLDSYLQAIDDAYGDMAPKLLENHRTELMNNFLSVDSVQEQLRGLGSEQRSEQLRDIRRGMGMDDEAVGRWDDLDRQRDQEWSEGEQYMKERDEIVASTQGEEQQRRLAELRKAHFGPEAEIIGDEEAGGFFRFQHPRRIGRE